MIKMSSAGEILSAILEKDTNSIMFLHNTRSEETAMMIMKEGFMFEEQLTFSTDRVNPSDSVEISYFLVERKEYGKFTIIIQIDKSLFRKYNHLAETSDVHFEELMTVRPPVLSDNDEFIYTLAPQYIRGYFNSSTGELIENPDFDPCFESPLYIANFNRIKNETAGS